MRLYTLRYDGKKYACQHYNRGMAHAILKQLLIYDYGEDRAAEIFQSSQIKVRKECDQVAFVVPETTTIHSV